MADELQRYEISILVGPCSQADAERAAIAAHGAAGHVVPGPGTNLNHWDEVDGEPGEPVDGVDTIGGL